jgi:hypothetical protein
MRDNPPGWYRDPDRPKWHRYWNGDSWDDPLEAALEAERPQDRDDREQPA